MYVNTPGFIEIEQRLLPKAMFQQALSDIRQTQDRQ